MKIQVLCAECSKELAYHVSFMALESVESQQSQEIDIWVDPCEHCGEAKDEEAVGE